MTGEVTIHVASSKDAGHRLYYAPQERIAAPCHGLESDSIARLKQVGLLEKAQAFTVGNPLKLCVALQVSTQKQFPQLLEIDTWSLRARANVKPLIHDVGREDVDKVV